MNASRDTRTLGLSILFSVVVIDCATTPPPVEPSRQPDVPGLVPIPVAASPSRPSGPARPAVSTADTPMQSPATRTEDIPAAPVGAMGCSARVGARTLKRSALSRTLDAGLGTWLRGVDVEPKIDRGRFQGWLVRGIYPGDPCWADIDLRAGDVVNRINRQPIERPEEAQAVWSALRGTGQIVIDLVRAGKPKTLRFDVVDDRE